MVDLIQFTSNDEIKQYIVVGMEWLVSNIDSITLHQYPLVWLTWADCVTDAFIAGDVTGSALKLERLIKLPYGNGEQNMVDFAPLVAVTRYLSLRNLISAGLYNRALTFMNQGETFVALLLFLLQCIT